MTGWLVALALCHTLDGGSTIAAFQRPHVHEVNPIMPRRPVFIVSIHLGAVTADAIALRSLARTRPTLARTLAGISTGISCGVGLSNLHQITKGK